MKKPRRGKTVCIVVLMLSALTLLSVSCRTCPETPEIEPLKIPLSWPTWPTPDEVSMEDGVVSMPLEYWLQVTEYVIEVDRIRKIVGEEFVK